MKRDLLPLTTRDRARADLAEVVKRYRRHNDRFERVTTVRHERWERDGLLKEEVRSEKAGH